MKMFNFLKPAPHIERLPADKVDATYKEFRYRNFVGIFLGYACYYFLRKNLGLVTVYLSADHGFTKSQIGWCLSAIPMAYGISKFIMGNLSDRSNPRYFIVTGLAISVIVNLIFGFVPGVTASLGLIFTLTFINGWASGMGSPPCYRTVAHWFSRSEKGRVMATWNVSHNIGQGLLGILAVFMLTKLHLSWQSVFYVPAVLVLVCSLIIVILMRDTPQSVGLMPIEEYTNEYPSGRKGKDIKNREKELTAKEILFKHVLINKYVWFLALANVFVYFIRYGISDWAPMYLSEVKGLDMSKGGYAFFIYELPGILGILSCGYVSDKVFKGRRAPVSIICMLMVCAGILLYWLSPSLNVSYLALVIIGTFIYGPVMLVGVQLLDIMPKKTVGTSIGFLGLFGYWFGNLSATVGFGYLSEHLGWNAVFATLTAACGLAILFFSFTLSIKKRVEEPVLEAA